MKRKSNRLISAFLVVAVAVCMMMPGAVFATDNAGSANAAQNQSFISQMSDVPLVNPVNVTFNANKGKVNGKSTFVVQVEKGARIGALPVPTYSKGIFKGWYTKKSGGKKLTANTKITKKVTYYAQWKSAVTVRFNVNGGVTANVTKMVEKGKQVGKLPAAPVRAGYKFMGWFTSKNEGNKVKASTKANKTVTYYAHWAYIQYNGKTYFQLQSTLTGKVLAGIKIEQADHVVRGSTLSVVFRNVGTKTIRQMQASGYELLILDKETGDLYGPGRYPVYVSGNGKMVKNFKKGKTYTDKVQIPSNLLSLYSAMQGMGYKVDIVAYDFRVSARV